MSAVPFLLREVDPKDLPDLYDLAGRANFINLPRDQNLLNKKVQRSVLSFRGKIKDPREGEYIFVLEDTALSRVVGTATVIARHGSPEEPHVFFSVIPKKKESKSLHMGFLHQVLRLGFDYDGPTEIGGLVLNPDYRGRVERLGMQLSYIRFVYMAARRPQFQSEVLAELLPPFNERGESPLWEAIGRKFTNMSYDEADRMSRRNKEFITALFPEGDIYTCMLPAEAREAIGQVGPATQPVKGMLEKIGFRYRQMVDPFDGGPHYWANMSTIDPVKRSQRVSYLAKNRKKNKAGRDVQGMLLNFSKKGLRASAVSGELHGRGKLCTLSLSQDVADVLLFNESSEAYFLESKT